MISGNWLNKSVLMFDAQLDTKDRSRTTSPLKNEDESIFNINFKDDENPLASIGSQSAL